MGKGYGLVVVDQSFASIFFFSFLHPRSHEQRDGKSSLITYLFMSRETATNILKSE